jgi:hypothetical protein
MIAGDPTPTIILETLFLSLYLFYRYVPAIFALLAALHRVLARASVIDSNIAYEK